MPVFESEKDRLLRDGGAELVSACGEPVGTDAAADYASIRAVALPRTTSCPSWFTVETAKST